MVTDNLVKTALVTGGGARIGRAISISLAEAGWRVAIQYGTSELLANKTVNEITSKGLTASAFRADFSREGEVKVLIDAINKKFGIVSCLINNASVFENDSFLTSSRESWDLHMEVNLRAPFLLSQIFANSLPEEYQGNIINIVDQRVLNLTEYFTSYTLSKSALWTLTQTAAMALAPNIRVNAISPGPTLPSSRQTDQDFEKQAKSMPLKRAVSLNDIEQAVMFILKTSSMTGEMITMDSGQHLGWAQPNQISDLEE